MAVGNVVNDKFLIGTSELRIGPQTQANMLDTSDSVGVIDDATLTIGVTSVDLKALFPRQIVATAIVEQAASVAATMREYSRKNLNVMLGGSVSDTAPTDVATTLATTASAGASTLVLTDATGFAAGDLAVVYPDGFPEQVSVVEIASIATETLTLVTGQTTQHAYNVSTGTIHVFKAQPIAIGSLERTNYFSMMLVNQDNRSGRPGIASFWKCAISGNVDIANNANDFASSKMDFKVLRPALAEFDTGGVLDHLAGLSATYKSGYVDMAGADDAVIA